MKGKAKLAGLDVERRLTLAQNLMQIQQRMGAAADPEQLKQQINELLHNLIPAQYNRFFPTLSIAAIKERA